MRPRDLPLVGSLLAVNDRDPVLNALVLLGPVLVTMVALAGRNPATVALATAYVLALPAYVVHTALRG